MKRVLLSAMALAFAGMASAQLAVSIGVRETAQGGGSNVGIGNNGGTAGGIEWINLDGQVLNLGGGWQQFTFTFGSDAATAFAGTTANGTLEGAFGVLEHIRIRNIGGHTNPLNVWVDDITNTTAAGGPTNFGSFEGYAAGTEVIFQEPGFSGSTSGNIDVTTDLSGVDDTIAYAGTNSYRFDFQFIDDATTRWVRLTTFNTPNVPNPMIDISQGSTLTFQMRAVPEPASMAALGLGVVALFARRRKK